jgi:DNA-binding NarL/FixJ family response regulator
MIWQEGHLLRTVIVEDSQDVQFLLRLALEGSGEFEVAGVAADGPTALDLVRAAQPDVVLLDLFLPGGNGLDLLPRLLEVAPAARVIVVSNAPRSRYADRALTAGACGFLEKHLPIQTLAAGLIGLLSAELVR